MESPVQVGEVLAGKYKVERILGSGAMGVVVAARHLDLQQLVALKFMLPAAVPDQAAGERFLREAQAAGRLRGEHVARVMDFGRLQGGAPYIVMEFLEGEDLEARLDRTGPMSVPDAAFHIAQACSAMAEAHAQGIVHRDLKPQNLFLTKRPDGSPLLKVLDFGISKLHGEVSNVTATQSSAVMGSPAYMSPEQARSAKYVDARGDIYSLGAILYQMVSGFLPFSAESVAGMLVAIVSEPPIPLQQVAPDVSPEFAALVHRCLEKDRDKRPQTARELAHDLAEFASRRTSPWEADTERVSGLLPDGHTKQAVPTVVVVTTMQPSSRPLPLVTSAKKIETKKTSAKAALEQQRAEPRSRAGMIGAAAIAVVLLLVALRFAIGRSHADASPSTSAPVTTPVATKVPTQVPTQGTIPPETASAVPTTSATAPFASASGSSTTAVPAPHVSHRTGGASSTQHAPTTSSSAPRPAWGTIAPAVPVIAPTAPPAST